MTKLLLWDIDGTLVLTGGAGGRAMGRAAQEVFALEDAVGSISMAGRTDAWIVGQMAKQHGVECTGPLVERFREHYMPHLEREIHQPGPQKGVLPGVRPLVEALARRTDVHQALLTGNFEAGARIKLEYFELWRFFSGGAFGDVSHDRNALLAVAMAQVRATGGPVVAPSDVWIIGDTPHDVAVAVSGGARSLAVATGGYSVEQLKASGADVVLHDLSDLQGALDGIGLTAGPG